MTAATDTAVGLEEHPAFFEAGTEELFGILTLPATPARGVGVLVLPGGRYADSSGRNRVSVRLAEALAAAGYHVMRFDYHGIGDSTGVMEEFRLDRPFVDDLRGAVRYLQARGIDRVAAIGDCFGARTALLGAVQLPAIAGAILVSLPFDDCARGEDKLLRAVRELGILDLLRYGLRWSSIAALGDHATRRAYARAVRAKLRTMRGELAGRLAARRRDRLAWVSRQVLVPLEDLARRRVPVLLLYGTEEPYYADYRRATAGWLGDILCTGSSIEVETLPGHVHALASVEVQECLVTAVHAWLEHRLPGDVAAR